MVIARGRYVFGYIWLNVLNRSRFLPLNNQIVMEKNNIKVLLGWMEGKID